MMMEMGVYDGQKDHDDDDDDNGDGYR